MNRGSIANTIKAAQKKTKAYSRVAQEQQQLQTQNNNNSSDSEIQTDIHTDETLHTDIEEKRAQESPASTSSSTGNLTMADKSHLLDDEETTTTLQSTFSIDSSSASNINTTTSHSSLPVYHPKKHDADFFASVDAEKTPRPVTTASFPPSPNDPTADNDDVDDCLQIASMIGLQYSLRREVAYYTLALLTGGLSLLFAFWFPRYALQHRYLLTTQFSTADFILVYTMNGQHEFCPIERINTLSLSEIPSTFGRYHRATAQTLRDEEKMIVFRHTRYVLHTATNTWQRVRYPKGMNNGAIKTRVTTGLHTDIAYQKLNLYGFNAITIVVPSIPSLLIHEVFHPFFVFQAYSVILWCVELYYYFAGCIAIIATVSIVTTLLETRKRLTSLSELARFEAQVKVLRDGAWSIVSSTHLVVGDVVEVTVGIVPCDLALVQGSCVVNESMLTGESLPIVKAPVSLHPTDEAHWINMSHGSHTLFSATKILQLKPAQPGQTVLAIVSRTGYATTKGSLILSILYPKPTSFKFVEQSYKFVATLFGLAMIGFGISVWQLNRVGAATSTIIIRALDLITIVVPPSLPLALSVGTNYALIKLKAEKLFCISPARINMAGKVRLMCFDKTGTLTSEGMELKGVLPMDQLKTNFTTLQSQIVTMGGSTTTPTHSNSNSYEDGDMQNHSDQQKILIPSFSDDETQLAMEAAVSSTAAPASTPTVHHVNTTLLTALATCHGLAVLDSDLIGDPLEIEIYKATHAKLQDTGELQGYQSVISIPAATTTGSAPTTPTHGANSTAAATSGSSKAQGYIRIGVKHQFAFVSALQRMSVLTVNLDTGETMAYVKGAPETIQRLCLPHTIPSTYTQTFTHYAHLGYRILAIAYKRLPSLPTTTDKATMRSMIESDLTLLGLIMLENKLKSETAPTLSVLHTAKLRNVMVTGDFPVTAITVAKECALVPEGLRIYQSVINSKTDEIEWIDSDDPQRKLDPLTLRRIPNTTTSSTTTTTTGTTSITMEQRYELAVSGDVYRRLESSPLAHAPFSLFHRVILASQIFARMTPDQKASLITEYMALGLYSGMCGDGANDCGALKAGHIGVSLSESEASIAAPFTYAKPHIGCIPILLSEGRSSLATSFSLFKYMAMYSFVQFTAVILTYFKGSVFGNWQYLYQDMIVVFLLTLLMGSTGANRALSIKRPSGNLLSHTNLFNVGIHMLINLLWQILVFFVCQQANGYVNYEIQPGFNNSASTWETTTMYYFSNFQLLLMAILFAMGHPWKKPVITNYKFCFWAVVCFVWSMSLLFYPEETGFFRVDDVALSNSWRGFLFLYVLLNALCSIVWEVYIFPWVLREYKVMKMSRRGVIGSVYGHAKRISGEGVKEYHQLRGEFELGWEQ